MSCGDGGMGGEDAFAADGFDVLMVERVPARRERLLVEQLHGEQAGVAFVHVEAREFMVAEFAQHPHAADAHHDFLAKPIPLIPAIKMVGDPAVPLRVFREVGIEQIDRHAAAFNARDVVLPCPEVDRAAADDDRGAWGELLEEILDLPFAGFLDLRAGGIESLAEIALAI